MQEKLDYDYIIIGSGFGGSVSAMRLAQKGYSVAVLEMGKRYRTGDFAKTNWNLKKYLWLPQLFLHGVQKLTLLKDVLILGGVGVGGGSLVYANTLLEPGEGFYRDPAVVKLSPDWKKIMVPFYAEAKRMLGATPNIHLSEPDRLLREYAREMGRENTWHSVNVGVYFGKTGEKHPDPFFGGEGPERTGCNFCGGCMVGCNHGAKNTLDKNYLYFAEKYGARIIPERKVTDIKYEDNVYKVSTAVSTSVSQRKAETYYGKGVIVSAGVLGTLKLLLACKKSGSLPNLPDSLGESVRTNSESLTGTTTMDKNRDWSKGIAITSGFYPTDDTHIEVVRYPEGSDFMASLATIMVENGNKLTRPLKLLKNIARDPVTFLKTCVPFNWAKRSIIFLVMQTLDNKITVKLGRFGNLTTALGDKSPTAFNEHANKIAQEFAGKTNGIAQSTVFEAVLDISTTAHIMGGCAIGKTAEDAVVDTKCEVFNNPNLHVIDGSIIPANLGVNPSLTITAMAEYAMSQIPARDKRKEGYFQNEFPAHQEPLPVDSKTVTKKRLLLAGASALAVTAGLIYLTKQKSK
jgi:cholesterol oxidase